MARTSASTDTLEVIHRDVRAVVRKNGGHPDCYLFIEVDGKTFFLGNRLPGITRGDVRRMAIEFLERCT